MDDSRSMRQPWPALDYTQWRDALATLHLWTQVVGKVRLCLTPWLNHGWQVPLYVPPRGLRTSTIHLGSRMLEIDFDFVDHRLVVRLSDGVVRGFVLEPMSVAQFYRRLMDELRAVAVEVDIDPLPNEVPEPVSAATPALPARVRRATAPSRFSVSAGPPSGCCNSSRIGQSGR